MVSLRVIQGRKVEWNRHDRISGHGKTRSLALPGVYVTNSCIRYPAHVVQSCPTLCNPMNCSTSGLPVLRSWSLLKFMSLVLTMPSNHLILCHPLFLLPSTFPSTRVYSNESALHIRWPKYWSFSFSISPSNEYSGLTGLTLGLTGLISLLSKRLSRVFSGTTLWKHQFFGAQHSLWSTSHICTWPLEKP